MFHTEASVTELRGVGCVYIIAGSIDSSQSLTHLTIQSDSPPSRYKRVSIYTSCLI